MSGYLGNLTPCQEQCLKEFKQSLSDVLKPKHDDHLLLQFLRARKFDVKNAETMFRRHLEFRKEFDEEYLTNEYVQPELLLQYALPPLLGYDKGGSPVRMINAGAFDIIGILRSFRRCDLRKSMTAILDWDTQLMKIRSKETGIHVETRTFICDLHGLSLRQIYHKDAYDCAISLLKLYENNYPENLKVVYIINTPSFFWWVFSMLKSFMSEETISKLKIYGHSGWKKDLLEMMDPEILPVIYGGTRTDEDGDPRCRNLIPQGGQIPTKYYLKYQQRLSQDEKDVTKVIISRRSKFMLPIRVVTPGSTICWEVDCKNCDIHLHLLFTDECGFQKVVVESTKVSDDLGLERGYFLAIKNGDYTLVLDNSYSILRSKTVLFKVHISTFTAANYEVLKKGR